VPAKAKSRRGRRVRAHRAWKESRKGHGRLARHERLWQQTKDALPLITPEGELNTRAKAEALLAQTLPHLPDSDFAKTKRQLQRPEMLNYLDRVQNKLAKLPFPEEVTQSGGAARGAAPAAGIAEG